MTGLAYRNPIGENIGCIKRGGATDEQSVALGDTKGHIGDNLRNPDLADQRSIRIVAMHNVSGAGPDAC